jgi:hypothetical protein
MTLVQNKVPPRKIIGNVTIPSGMEAPGFRHGRGNAALTFRSQDILCIERFVLHKASYYGIMSVE